MAEIVLGVTTGLGVIVSGLLFYRLLHERKVTWEQFESMRVATAEFRKESEARIAEQQRERDVLVARHSVELAAANGRTEQAIAYGRTSKKQEQAEHAALVAHLEKAAQDAAEAATAALMKYEALTGGHEFHKGGKVASHGGVQVLYNCVTCPPEANVRVLAPRGFFAPEVDDGEET